MRRLCDVGVTLHDCEHRTPKPSPNGGFPYIAIPDLRAGRIDLTDVRLISEADYESWTRKIRPQAGDVIVTRRGRVGDTAVVPEGLRCAIGQNLVLLRSDGSCVSQRYLRWALRGPLYQQQVNKYRNVGAVFDSLNCEHIPLFEIPIPPTEAQRRIAGVLGALDTMIEHNGARASREAELLSGAFRASFSPVSRLAQGAPRGWRVGVLGDEVDVVMGQSPPGSTYTDDTSVGLPLIQGSADLGDRYPEPTRHTTAPIKRSRAGDVIFTVRAPVGELNVADREYCLGRGVAAIRSDIPVYAEQLVRALAQRWSAEEAGTIFPSVNRSQILGLPIVRPPQAATEEFDRTFRPLFDSISELHRATRSLAAIRDAILPRLVAGSMLVSEDYEPGDSVGVAT
jgi:type I restriction enzyme S subunit